MKWQLEESDWQNSLRYSTVAADRVPVVICGERLKRYIEQLIDDRDELQEHFGAFVRHIRKLKAPFNDDYDLTEDAVARLVCEGVSNTKYPTLIHLLRRPDLLAIMLELRSEYEVSSRHLRMQKGS